MPKMGIFGQVLGAKKNSGALRQSLGGGEIPLASPPADPSPGQQDFHWPILDQLQSTPPQGDIATLEQKPEFLVLLGIAGHHLASAICFHLCQSTQNCWMYTAEMPSSKRGAISAGRRWMVSARWDVKDVQTKRMSVGIATSAQVLSVAGTVGSLCGMPGGRWGKPTSRKKSRMVKPSA